MEEFLITQIDFERFLLTWFILAMVCLIGIGHYMLNHVSSTSIVSKEHVEDIKKKTASTEKRLSTVYLLSGYIGVLITFLAKYITLGELIIVIMAGYCLTPALNFWFNKHKKMAIFSAIPSVLALFFFYSHINILIYMTIVWAIIDSIIAFKHP